MEENKLFTCTLPEGITINKTPWGYGIFTTRARKEGTVIYNNDFYYYEAVDPKKPLPKVTLRVNDSTDYPIDIYMHMIELYDKRRIFYYFDSFMNHNCNPNTRSEEIEFREDGGVFSCIATRDIKEGEQLTCDYDLVDWDCYYDEYDEEDKGKEVHIDLCSCGAVNCRKKVYGFKHINEELQKQMIDKASSSVKKSYEDYKKLRSCNNNNQNNIVS